MFLKDSIRRLTQPVPDSNLPASPLPIPIEPDAVETTSEPSGSQAIDRGSLSPRDLLRILPRDGARNSFVTRNIQDEEAGETHIPTVPRQQRRSIGESGGSYFVFPALTTRFETISTSVSSAMNSAYYLTRDAARNNFLVFIERYWSLVKLAAVEGQYLENFVHFSTLFSSLAVIATSKMMEEEKEKMGLWKWTFISLYLLWGGCVSSSLYFDWYRSEHRLLNTICHIGCSSILLYFFASILSIKTPTTVLPICINLGLLSSLGLQRISPDIRDRIFGWIGTCLGMPYQGRRGIAV